MRKQIDFLRRVLTSDRFLVVWTVFYCTVLFFYATARAYSLNLLGGG